MLLPKTEYEFILLSLEHPKSRKAWSLAVQRCRRSHGNRTAKAFLRYGSNAGVIPANCRLNLTLCGS